MSAVTPSPAPPLLSPSSNNIQPPSSSTTPPPQQSSANTPQPPSFITSPPLKQPSSPPPNSSLSPPPATSPPPPTRLAPPPTVPSTPPPSQLAPPPTVPSVPPPSQLAPPPTVPSVPPPSQLAPPPSQSPPLSPPVASPPTSPSRPPPPPPPTTPARRSPPPQSSVPPRSSPPPSPPPPFTPPPSNPAPPLASPPGENSPPPAAVPPPRRSPPPPPRNSTSTPPRASPPVAVSPPPPPLFTPPPLSTPPSSTPPPTNSPPSSTTPSSQPAPPSKSTPSSQSAPPPLTRSLPSPPPPQNRSENSSPESESSGGIGTGAVVAIAVCGGILLLGFIGVALWCLKRHKRRNPPNDGYVMPFTLPSSTESESSFLNKLSSAPLIKSNSGSEVVYTPSDTGGMGHSRNWFSYEELIKATNGFSTQNILGEGGFGFVYKGCLPDGREIAVKQLRIGGAQGEKEFKAEVEIISRIHHRHLVSLVGYCIQDNRRLLVYDYVPNNTLHFHLHGEGQPVLEWPNRVKIAAGAARGIAYLHEDCNPRIIHRDIKPSNILLDYNYEARVADFGLAKLVLDTYTPITTRVMGTFGYVAPEYASSGKLTEKSDVYSFGVVLLELITGRKPIDESQSLEDECLVEWARPLLSDALETQKFESLVDPKLEKNYVESEMFCMIQLAAVCVRHSASKRPCMGQVVRAFDSLAASDLTNGMRVGESQALNSTQQAQQRWFQRAAVGSFSTDFFSQESLNT